MGKKQFLINLISNFLSIFLQMGIGFVLTPYIIRSLGVGAYGFFPLSNNFIGYLGLITVAFNSMGSRFIIINLQQENRVVAKEYFNTLFYSNLFLALSLGLVGLLATYFIKYLLNVPPGNLDDVKLLFFLIVLDFIVSLSTSIFEVGPMTVNRLDITAIRNIFIILFRSLMLIGLFSLLSPKLYYLGFTALGCTVILSIIDWNLIKRFLPGFGLAFKFFRWSHLKELLSSGIWNAINQLSIILLTQLDLLLANVFISAVVMGELSITKVVPNFIQTIVGVLVAVFVPKFYMLYGKGDKGGLLKELFFSIKIVSMLVIIPISYFIIYGIDFFRLYTPEQNIELINRLSILTIIPMVVTGSINTLFNIYTVTNKTKTPAIVWVIFGLINTLLIYLGIKYLNLGIYSIPIVGLVTGLLRNLIFTPIYGAYCLELKWTVFYKGIFRGMLCGIFMIITCSIFKYYFKVIPNNWFQFTIIAMVTGAIALLPSIAISFNRQTIFYYLNLVLNKYVKRI